MKPDGKTDSAVLNKCFSIKLSIHSGLVRNEI